MSHWERLAPDVNIRPTPRPSAYILTGASLSTQRRQREPRRRRAAAGQRIIRYTPATPHQELPTVTPSPATFQPVKRASRHPDVPEVRHTRQHRLHRLRSRAGGRPNEERLRSRQTRRSRPGALQRPGGRPPRHPHQRLATRNDRHPYDERPSRAAAPNPRRPNTCAVAPNAGSKDPHGPVGQAGGNRHGRAIPRLRHEQLRDRISVGRRRWAYSLVSSLTSVYYRLCQGEHCHDRALRLTAQRGLQPSGGHRLTWRTASPGLAIWLSLQSTAEAPSPAPTADPANPQPPPGSCPNRHPSAAHSAS